MTEKAIDMFLRTDDINYGLQTLSYANYFKEHKRVGRIQDWHKKETTIMKNIVFR